MSQFKRILLKILGINIEKRVQSVMSKLEDDVQTFEKEADDALSMFKKAVKKINKSNKKIDSRISTASYEVDRLNKIKENLETRKANNMKVKAKFEDFITA